MSLRERLAAVEAKSRAEMELIGLRRQLSESSKHIKNLGKVIEQANQRIEVVFALKSHRAKMVAPVRAKGAGSQSTAFIHLSDWHAEETVDPRTVNGKNEYSLDIAKVRVTRCIENALKLIELNRQGTRIDTLIIGLLGDFMTGYIHEELLEGNALSPVETVLWLKDVLTWAIKKLIKESGCTRVIIPCTVGNHGRTTVKKRVATSTRNSYEWLLYKILAAEIPTAEWIVADGSHAYVDVFGYTVRCQHGDAFKYQGGIGGITIPVLKAIPKWNGIRRADLDVFGHWHQFMAHRLFVCNSSLIGYNAYALEIKAEYEPPAQTFFLIEAEHGRTITTPIFVD